MAQGWKPPIAHLVGFRLTEIQKGRAEVELQARSRAREPDGDAPRRDHLRHRRRRDGDGLCEPAPADESFTTVELK